MSITPKKRSRHECTAAQRGSGLYPLGSVYVTRGTRSEAAPAKVSRSCHLKSFLFCLLFFLSSISSYVILVFVCTNPILEHATCRNELTSSIFHFLLCLKYCMWYMQGRFKVATVKCLMRRLSHLISVSPGSLMPSAQFVHLCVRCLKKNTRILDSTRVSVDVCVLVHVPFHACV